MNTKIFGFLCVFACFTTFCKAQTNALTIDTVTIYYKIVQTINPDSISSNEPFTLVNTEAHISLNPAQNPGTIFLRMRDNNTNEILSASSYSLNASPIINNGVTVFERAGNEVIITTSEPRPLQLYKYEIYTIDTQNNNSSIYTLIK